MIKIDKKQNIGDLNYYHWFYEPDCTSIKIKPSFTKKIFKIALKKAKSMTNLAKSTVLSKVTLFNHLYGKSMNVKGLKKLLDYVDLDYVEAEYFVEEISWNKIAMPISLNSPESAVVFAAILGDGSNSEVIMYKNKNEELIKKVESAAKKWLGNVYIHHRVSDDKIPFINLPIITGRIFNYIGIPTGKQTFIDPRIPKVIRKSDKKVKRTFIQQFFDDEGWPEPNQMRVAACQGVDCSSKLTENFKKSAKNKRLFYLKEIPSEIRTKLEPPKLLIDINEMLLQDFNIESNIRQKRILNYKTHCTALFELEIQKKESVKRFLEEISFFSTEKREKLEFMISRNRELPKDVMIILINEGIKLSKDKGYFLACEIANKLGYPQPPVRKRLRTLVKLGILNKEKEKFYVNIKF